jgi:putative flippase GtrA
MEYWYERYRNFTPAPLRRLLTPFISSPQTLRWFLLYGCIGASGVAVFLGLVWLFARMHVMPVAASGIAFACGASLQFFLNRNYNFRAFDRAASHQARTYAAVMSINFALTLLIVACAVHAGIGAVQANLLTLVVTFPVAFLANRHLTFGPGITARVRESRERLQRRRDERTRQRSRGR